MAEIRPLITITAVGGSKTISAIIQPRRYAYVDDLMLDALRKYRKQGKISGEVWVTPDLPFLVFITGGFVMSTFLGGLFLG